LEPLARIQILEGALESAVTHATKLAQTIQLSLGGLDSNTSVIREAGQLREWAEKAGKKQTIQSRIRNTDDRFPESISKDRFDLKVLIGVQGQTGAGKSSLLNALLGYKDLLPCDMAEASTATVCEVSYNHSDEPSELFKATIHFRTRKDVKDELVEFFKWLEERRKLLNPGPDDPPTTEDERDRALEELDANIAPVADKIRVVWGKTLADLTTGKLTVGDFLSKDNPATKYLGKQEYVKDTTLEGFAPKVKPYLDSTLTNVSNGKTTTYWPLIDHVEIHLKAEVLKGGIVLVDLPGLSDAVSARMAVARRYYEKLAVAVVVAPAIRAADENTAVDLMSKNQELQLRMDNKLNESCFCVVLSKIDDGVDWMANARREGRDGQVMLAAGIQKATNEDAAAIKNYKNSISRLRTAERNATEPDEKSRIRGEKAEFERKRKKLMKERKRKQEQYFLIAGEETFRATQARNAVLRRRIADHLLARHENFIRRSKGDAHHVAPFKVPKVFPVSSKAYWNLLIDGCRPLDGFPKAQYTGIPALAAWLRETTIPQRQRELTALLNRYMELLSNLQTWSNDQCRINKLAVSYEDLKSSVMDKHRAELEKKLSAFTKKLETKVKNCDPFKARDKALTHCGERAVAMVEQWVIKFPNEADSSVKMNWMTFRAIIRREGADFVGRYGTGGAKRTYNWMRDMADAFKEQIAGDWIEQLHHRIPELEGPAAAEIDKICSQVMKQVGASIRSFVPEIAQQKEYLSTQIKSLNFVRDQLKDRIGQALVRISDRSPAMHASLQDQLKSKWQPGFKKAKKVPGGTGIRQRQHGILVKHAKDKGKTIFKDAVVEMEAGFQAELAQFPLDLQKAWDDVLTKFYHQLELIIQNILQAASAEANGELSAVSSQETEATRAVRQDLQLAVRKMLAAW
ncbi:hypothetical protein QBC47DRAFT_429883, partial [Echria macrotheca]